MILLAQGNAIGLAYRLLYYMWRHLFVGQRTLIVSVANTVSQEVSYADSGE